MNYEYIIENCKHNIVIIKHAYYSGIPIEVIVKKMSNAYCYRKWSKGKVKNMVYKLIYVLEMERKQKYEQISNRIYLEKASRFRE